MMDEDFGTTIRYTVTRYTGTYLVEEPPELRVSERRRGGVESLLPIGRLLLQLQVQGCSHPAGQPGQRLLIMPLQSGKVKQGLKWRVIWKEWPEQQRIHWTYGSQHRAQKWDRTFSHRECQKAGIIYHRHWRRPPQRRHFAMHTRNTGKLANGSYRLMETRWCQDKQMRGPWCPDTLWAALPGP